MNKRQRTLEHIRVAAYEGDMRTAMRLYVENRNIGYAAFNEAVQTGRRQRENGFPNIGTRREIADWQGTYRTFCD